MSQSAGDSLHQHIGLLAVGRPAMGHDHGRSERMAELHRVLQRGQTLGTFVGILGSERGEIRGMDRQPHLAIRRRLSELCAPPLLPRELGDERQLKSCESASEQTVKKAGVVHPLGGQRRKANGDHGRPGYVSGSDLRAIEEEGPPPGGPSSLAGDYWAARDRSCELPVGFNRTDWAW